MFQLSEVDMAALVHLKMRDLIAILQKIDTVEKRKDFFNSIISSIENPATKAARTLAIKNSNQIELIRKEVENPTFDSGKSFQDLRKPSLFTSDYQVTDTFVNSTEIIEENTIMELPIGNVIEVYKNKEEQIAHIILLSIATQPEQ